MSNSTYLAKGEDTEFEIIITDSRYITLNSLGERNPNELELFSAVRQILAPICFAANPRVHPALFIKRTWRGNSIIAMEQTFYVNGSHYPSRQTTLYEINSRGEVLNLCANLRDFLDLMVDRRELRIDFIAVNKTNYNKIDLNIRPDERNLIHEGRLFGRVYFYDTFVEELPDVNIKLDVQKTIPLNALPQFVLLDRVYLCKMDNCEYCTMECDNRFNGMTAVRTVNKVQVRPH